MDRAREVSFAPPLECEGETVSFSLSLDEAMRNAP
jgi:hypothetical protein